jgi:hypothetical protein
MFAAWWRRSVFTCAFWVASSYLRNTISLSNVSARDLIWSMISLASLARRLTSPTAVRGNDDESDSMDIVVSSSETGWHFVELEIVTVSGTIGRVDGIMSFSSSSELDCAIRGG